MRVRKAILRSFSLGSYTATVEIFGSHKIYLESVVVTRNLPSAEMTAGRKVVVVFFDDFTPTTRLSSPSTPSARAVCSAGYLMSSIAERKRSQMLSLKALNSPRVTNSAGGRVDGSPPKAVPWWPLRAASSTRYE